MRFGPLTRFECKPQQLLYPGRGRATLAANTLLNVATVAPVGSLVEMCVHAYVCMCVKRHTVYEPRCGKQKLRLKVSPCGRRRTRSSTALAAPGTGGLRAGRSSCGRPPLWPRGLRTGCAGAYPASRTGTPCQPCCGFTPAAPAAGSVRALQPFETLTGVISEGG